MPQITPQLVLSTSFTIDSLAHRATKAALRTVSFNKQTSKVVPVHTMKSYRGRRGKVVPVHTMKPYRGRTDTAPLILNLCTDGGQWSTSRLGRSSRGTERRYSLKRSMAVHQSRS
jgi:hypothetical protein